MRRWPFLLVSFGAMLGLIGVSAWALHQRMVRVRVQVQGLQQNGDESSRLLQDLRSSTYQAAILLRDFVLDRSVAASANQTESLRRLRGLTADHMAVLSASGGFKDSPEMQELEGALRAYWRVLEPILDLTPMDKATRGSALLRDNLTPHRENVFRMTSEIENLSRTQARIQQREILRRQEGLEDYLKRFAAAALTLGAVIAVVSITRTRALEATAERHVRQIERGVENLRQLSSSLSNAQEEERRRISRELHDQVGQMLTALRMELANLAELRHDKVGFDGHAASARKLTDETPANRPGHLDGFAPFDARRTGPRIGAPMAGAGLLEAQRSARGRRHRRSPRQIAGQPQDVRLPRGAGSSHQLRAPRQGKPDQDHSTRKR